MKFHKDLISILWSNPVNSQTDRQTDTGEHIIGFSATTRLKILLSQRRFPPLSSGGSWTPVQGR